MTADRHSKPRQKTSKACSVSSAEHLWGAKNTLMEEVPEAKLERKRVDDLGGSQMTENLTSSQNRLE